MKYSYKIAEKLRQQNIENKKLLQEIHIEQNRLTRQRINLNFKEKEFENRMRYFRTVCSVAWDAVMNPNELPELRRILEKTDRLWEGFAGVIRDHREPENSTSVPLRKIDCRFKM